MTGSQPQPDSDDDKLNDKEVQFELPELPDIDTDNNFDFPHMRGRDDDQRPPRCNRPSHKFLETFQYDDTEF